MPVAEQVDGARTRDMETRLRLHFRIELLEVESVCGDVGGKADEVLLCHGMVQRHVPIVLYPLDGKGMRVIWRLRLLGQQLASTAAKRPLAHGMDHVAADGAHVKAAARHVARAVGVLAHIAAQKLRHGDAQRCRQSLYQRNVRQAAPFI